MTSSEKAIRDPLWETVHLDAMAVSIIDTAEFQRLRYIRQGRPTLASITPWVYIT